MFESHRARWIGHPFQNVVRTERRDNGHGFWRARDLTFLTQFCRNLAHDTTRCLLRYGDGTSSHHFHWQCYQPFGFITFSSQQTHSEGKCQFETPRDKHLTRWEQMAEASGSRAHRRQENLPTAGFEV